MTKETAKKGYYDLELMATRKRDEHGNPIGFEVKNVTYSEQDRSSVEQALGEAIRNDARQMLVESRFQESLVSFAKTGPDRPVTIWLGHLRTIRLGRVKRGPGKGRMRTLKQFERFKYPAHEKFVRESIKPRLGDFEIHRLQPPAATVLADVHYSLPNVPPELLRGDVYFASEMAARHAAPRTILDGVKDESENL